MLALRQSEQRNCGLYACLYGEIELRYWWEYDNRKTKINYICLPVCLFLCLSSVFLSLAFFVTYSVNIHQLLTFGIAVFSIFNIVVIVNTEVIPRAMRAAVASGGIQNDIQDKITMSAQGA